MAPPTKTSVARGVARDGRAPDIDIANLVGQPVRHQLHSIPAERIRFDDVDASLDVIQVNFPNQVRVRHVQFIETSADEDALAVEHRAHCTVTHQNPILQFWIRNLS